MINPGVWLHFGKLLLALVIAALAGWLAGYPLMVPGALAAVYLTWQTFNAVRLYHLLQAREGTPPKSFGLWKNIFTAIDGLQRQKTEEFRRYQESIDDFEEMARIFPDATLVIDESDVVRWRNDSATQLLKLESSSRNGGKITSLIRDPNFADWLAKGDFDENSLIIHSPVDNDTILQVTAVPFRSGRRLLILQDTTEIQNTERLRRDLVANVSHELRTPLTVLLGYLEILMAQPEEAKPKAIKRMFKQARQMHAMLEDLLELSRLQQHDKPDDESTVDVPVLLAQLKEQARDISRGRHEFRFSVDKALKIRGVEADLKSAFQNLIVNAVNYTPDNGVIRVSWQQTSEHIVLSVRDNGIGIPYRDIPRLTERFYRVGDDRNRKTGGTGLGLAIVKHVLMNHGAQLDISSEVSKGSVFHCLFPLSRKA